MGAALRAHDWSRSPLGPPESWPPSLLSALGICFHSRFPVLIFWGPELVMLYNDAYRPVLGTKHPNALGMAAEPQWPELWDVVGPMLHGVLETGAATWSEDLRLSIDRRGFVEDAYFTFSYSAIRAEDGAIGGVFCIAYESTDKVLGERRLQVLQRLAADTQGANDPRQVCERAAASLAGGATDLPFALLYLLDADAREARLEASSGLARGSVHAPDTLWVGDDTGRGWPVSAAVQDGETARVEDLAERFGGAPAPARGPAIDRALVLPLAIKAEGQPLGILIAGVSPRLQLDDRYAGFLELVARQLTTSLSSARAFADEVRRAEMLAELDRAKTTFFSNVSHELRTPLTLLLNPLEEMLDDDGEAAELRVSRESIALAHRNALRLMKLVNTLLDFSRLEAGRARATYQPTRLDTFTIELVSSFQSALERAGLRLEVDCPPLSEPIYVDRSMYEKVVLNLLSNALKFTFEGEVSVRLRELPDRVSLEVRDTGTGIPPAELPHVFDRFHRVDGARSRSQEGSGIGLALVQEMVRLHHGEVTVTSTEGKGSTFTVTLPRGHRHLRPEQLGLERPLGSGQSATTTAYVSEALRWLPEHEPEPPTPAGKLRAEGTAGARVLLADDNADMRQYIQRLLSRHWSVEAVSNGTEALAAARRRPPDLVVSDVMMPGLSGFQLLQALRADAKTKGVPVILLSARAGEEASIEGMEAGADDYLVKPFSARELISRVAARLEISRARDQASKALARLHAHLMQAPMPVAIVTGPDLTYELANPSYLTMVNRTELVGRTFHEAFPGLPPTDPVWGLYRRVMETGTPFNAEDYPVPMGVPGSDAARAVHHFKFTLQPTRDLDGKVTGVMSIAIDVTDQVMARRAVERSRAAVSRLAESERAARTRAEDADRRKDEFLAMLAHELRNPLAALSTALTLRDRLDNALSPDEATLRLQDTCNRQVANLVRLVDDLLDISRITRGRVELRMEELELGAAVQSAIQAVRPVIDSRHHTLSISFAPGAFRLRADPTRLEQILSNLLVNAAKYTPEGGQLAVRVASESHDGAPWAAIHVRDSGLGISQEVLPRVFDLFVQADHSLDRSSGGLGIGLTLVRGLVELHGGTVTASSEGPGKGSEFTVRLPLLREAARPAPVERRPGTVASLQEAPSSTALRTRARREREGPSRRILLVEDTEDVRETLKELLEAFGHQVDVATDGVHGVERVLALRPDLSLIDVGLPGVDGYELARRVRAAPGGRDLFLVALTGYGGPEARRLAQEAGFDRHLVKPLDPRELPELILAAGQHATPPPG